MVQIPVFIALYWVLLASIELRHAPWLGWIQDLSAPDPYFILPVIYAVSMFVQTKYQNRSAPISFADGVEARLIEAENLVRSGGAYLPVLNALRASLPSLIIAPPGPANLLPNAPVVAALPALVAPATQTDQISQVFQERAYWLFLTGHRLGDMRRLIKHIGRGAETVFPSGTYFKGGAYGVDVNFPVPFPETNNQNFTGCLDRNP